MNLAFRLLKSYFPELNEEPIGTERIIQVLGTRAIQYYEVPMDGPGAYVVDASDGSEYVFIKNSIRGILKHETVAYECVHGLCHVPAATFLKRRHDLEAEALSLVMMMPAPELPRLDRIKHQLEPESYDRVIRRLMVKALWGI